MNENQYIVFKLQDEEFAIDITKIYEINRLKEIKITQVPKVPKFIEGIINLRGKVVPIVNLRKKLGMKVISIEKEARIIIVKIKKHAIGVLVDSVSHVEKFKDEEILAPTDELKSKCKHISNLGKKDGRVIFILNIDRLFNLEEEQVEG